MSAFAAKPDRFSSDLIIPGRVQDGVGFIDLQNPIDTPQGFKQAVLSIEGLRQLSRRHPQIGLVPSEDLSAAYAESEELREQLAAARARIAELEGQLARITGVAREGFIIHKQRGPAPTRRT